MTSKVARGVHPIAELFPLMVGTDLAALVTDIQKNGLREAIWLTSDGLVIDGRNRLLACKRAGIQPTFRTWAGDEGGIPAFVASMNLHRRHLRDEQRAFIAARMANMKRGEDLKFFPRDEQGRMKPGPSPEGSGKPLVTEAQAASVMSVSAGAIQRAKAVIKHAPELEAPVVKGEVTLSRAGDEAASRSRGTAPKGALTLKKGKPTLTRFELGVASLRRFLIEFTDVKRLAPITEHVRAFLRENGE